MHILLIKLKKKTILDPSACGKECRLGSVSLIFFIWVIIIVEHAIVIMKWRTALFLYRQKYTVLFKCSSMWAVGFVWCPSSVFKLSYFDISETTEAIFFPISARRSIGLSICKNADRSTFCTFSQKWIKLLLIFTIIAQIACLEILSIQIELNKFHASKKDPFY
jgi:hypothetical protein